MAVSFPNYSYSNDHPSRDLAHHGKTNDHRSNVFIDSVQRRQCGKPAEWNGVINDYRYILTAEVGVASSSDQKQ